ncbi:MAG TPA: PKD domain-containing protein, partial [Thermoplasmatales archaeon]|nr:PKD domain-containing protein [Thermoplasmatales archaeon]
MRVKAKDKWGVESEWSDPLPISMSKTYINTIPRLLQNKFHILIQKCKRIETNIEGKPLIIFSEAGEKIDHSYPTYFKEDDNVLPNPSFEEGDTTPDGWESWDYGTGGIFLWDSKDAHSGEKSVGITNLNICNQWCKWHTQDFIPFRYSENKVCNYAFWYKSYGHPASNRGMYIWVGLELYDENKEWIIGVMNTPEFSDEWVYHKTDTARMLGWLDKDKLERIRYIKPALMLVSMSATIEPDPSIEVRFDDIYLSIFNDTLPDKPDMPSGPQNGKPNKIYTYETTTVDPDGDEVYYLWDWGDGTNSGWIGPYKSGEVCQASHSWTKKGSYQVKVKAKDIYNLESEWSDPLPISMSKTSIYKNIISKLLQKYLKIETKTDDKEEYWALLIAVGEYLNHPEKDRPEMLTEVENINNALINSKNWDTGHIYKIKGVNADLQHIIDGFLWLLQMEDENDYSLIYITTHGGYLNKDIPPFDESDSRDEVLVPYEGFEDTSKFLWDDEINFFCSMLQSKGVCLIVDSCFSGGFNDVLNIQNIRQGSPNNWVKEFINDLSNGRRVILMSCEEDELSYGSYFSRYIAEALNGNADKDNNGIVSAEETFYYANDKV